MNTIFRRFTQILKTNTLRQAAITFSATFVNGTLGFFYYATTARYLGPENFGILTISLTVLALFADIGNFGINAGLVNFVSKFKTINILTSQRYLKLSLKLKLYIGFVTIIIGYLISPILSVYIFHKPELLIPLRLAFFGVSTTWLFSFATSYFQAFEKFISWGLIQIMTNLLRLSMIIILYLYSVLDINYALISYIVMPLFGFLITMAYMPKDFLKVKNENKLTSKFLNFNKWIGVSAVASSLSSKLDTFILAALLTSRDVGIYSAAYQIVQVVPQLVTALGTVIAPKFASFRFKEAAVEYYFKTQKLVIIISILGISGIPVFKLLIPFLLGNKYNDSFVVFSIILLGMLLFLLATPIHNLIIYYYNNTKLLSLISSSNLVILLILGYLSVIKFGVIGMASVTVILNLINLIVPAIWLKRKIS